MATILTDYYQFERTAEKSKTRLDCVASTFSHPSFELARAIKAIKSSEKRDGTAIGDLVVYIVETVHIECHDARKADKSITIKGANLSSIYKPDITSSYGYGDIQHTADALLFVEKDLAFKDGAIQPGGQLEIFVARGQEKNKIGLYQLLSDGELDEEMANLRNKAEKVTKSVTHV